MITLTIGGVDRSDELIKGSLSGSDEINSRSNVSFKLADLYSNGKPQIGEEVIIKDKNDNTIFGGTVDAGVQQRMWKGNDILQWTVPCVDFHQLVDKRVIAEVYENQKAGYIVKDIITNYLSDENITQGNIKDGPELTKVVFNYRYANDCLDELSEITGYQWRVNYDKSLDFYTRDTFDADYDVDDNTNVYGITVEDNRDDYRNKQYLRAGKDKTTVTQTDKFKGDDEVQTFTCELPLAEEPSVTINPGTTSELVIGSTDIGIRSVEEGKLWYWAKEDKQVSQTSTGTPLSSSDVLKVDYTGLFPIIIQAQDDVSILNRRSVESNSGLYEAIDQKAEIDDSDAALEFTKGKLRRYAELNENITYRTEEAGLKAGMLQNIVRSDHSIDGDYLIESVQFSAVGDGEIEYTVKAISGEAVGGWVQFFKKLLQTGEDYVIRDNEVLVRLKSFSDDITLTDTFTKTQELYYVWNEDREKAVDYTIPSTAYFDEAGRFLEKIWGKMTSADIDDANTNFDEVV